LSNPIPETVIDKDGVEDIVAGGNQYHVQAAIWPYDASQGWLFRGVLNGGKFTFERG